MLLIKLLTLDFCERREAQLSCKNLKYLLVLQRYRKELRVSATISMCFQSNLPFRRKSGAFADLWDNIKKMLKNENKSSSKQFSLAGARVQCWRAGPCSVSLIKMLSRPSLSVQGWPGY